jgi:hypothetical protein
MGTLGNAAFYNALNHYPLSPFRPRQTGPGSRYLDKLAMAGGEGREVLLTVLCRYNVSKWS